MIRINFAKNKGGKSTKPGKSFSPPKLRAPGKNTLYLIALLSALGLGLYSYMPDIVNYFYASPPPVAFTPKPIQPAPESAPLDTPETAPEETTETAAPAVEEKPPVEQPVVPPVERPAEQPAEKPREQTPPPVEPAERKPVSTITLAGNGASIGGQVAAYLAMRNALPAEKKYSLLAVAGGSFTSEISAASQDAIVQYNENLKSQLPGSVPRVQPGLPAGNPAEKRTIISGRYRTGTHETRQNIQERSPEDIVRRLYTVAQRNGFKLTGKTIGASTAANGSTRTPLILKFTGNETSTPSFLAAFRREPLNVELEKISGVPLWDAGNSMVQLALNLIVVRGK